MPSLIGDALFDLSKKTIVVIGGAGILGEIYCIALAQSGATVIIGDFDSEKGSSLLERLRAISDKRHYFMYVDLTDEFSIIQFASNVHSKFDSIDVLINNAASKSEGFFDPLESYTLKCWNEVMSVNLTSIFLMCREFGRFMAKNGVGSIINISSIYGLVGPDQRIYEGARYDAVGGSINTPLVYSASKGAVVALTRYLATYWGKNGVRSNCVTPGGVESGQNEDFVYNYSTRVPLGRMAQKNELIGAIIYLSSDSSSYINGHNLVIDGGWTSW